MKAYIAERFRQRQSALSLDARALARYPDVIDLSIGDPDLATDSRVIEAAFSDAAGGCTHYGDPKGDPELIAAICAAWAEDFGQSVSPGEVLVTASSCLGMAQVLFGILNPGDEVLVFGPYFAVYRQQVELAGGRVREVRTTADSGYRPARTAIEQAITPRTRAMIVNTPANPTGAAYDEATLHMLADVARRHDLLVIADEIYTRFLFEGSFAPFRTLPGMADRTVTLNSFSKNFMMTGWRVGAIIAHPELVDVFQRVNGGLIYTAPSVSQRAAVHALKLRRELWASYHAIYKERVYYASDAIEKMPYFSLCRPKGTFYLFPRIALAGADDRAFCGLLLDRAHVLVSPGSAFGQAGEGHIRIACTVPMDRLREGMGRLRRLKL